jgi:hypothetical protein
MAVQVALVHPDIHWNTGYARRICLAPESRHVRLQGRRCKAREGGIEQSEARLALSGGRNAATIAAWMRPSATKVEHNVKIDPAVFVKPAAK